MEPVMERGRRMLRGTGEPLASSHPDGIVTARPEPRSGPLMKHALSLVSALSLAAGLAGLGSRPRSRPEGALPPVIRPQSAQLDGVVNEAAFPGSPLLRLCFLLGVGGVGVWIGRKRSALADPDTLHPDLDLPEPPRVDLEADLRAGREVQELM